MTLASNWTKKETGLTLFCGHWKYPEPYCRIHCSVAFAICPGSLLWKMLGSWMKLWGLSSKQDEPEPLKTNGVKMCYRELLNVLFDFMIFFFHATVQNLWFRSLLMLSTSVVLMVSVVCSSVFSVKFLLSLLKGARRLKISFSFSG